MGLREPLLTAVPAEEGDANEEGAEGGEGGKGEGEGGTFSGAFADAEGESCEPALLSNARRGLDIVTTKLCTKAEVEERGYGRDETTYEVLSGGEE